MSWFGKMVGGTIGFALGGPLGAMLGATFGHAYDENGDHRLSDEMNLFHAQDQTGEQARLIFFVAGFSMLAKLAKETGHISQEKIDEIKRFISQELNLGPEERKVAVDIFCKAAKSQEPFSYYAKQFYSQFKGHHKILEFIVDAMIRVSVANGDMDRREETLILSAVSIFSFSKEKYLKMKSKHVNETDRFYTILKCRRTDTIEDIKRQYRKLVFSYHPDKVSSMGLPEDFIKFSGDRFLEIQSAYQIVRRERGF